MKKLFYSALVMSTVTTSVFATDPLLQVQNLFRDKLIQVVKPLLPSVDDRGNHNLIKKLREQRLRNMILVVRSLVHETVIDDLPEEEQRIILRVLSSLLTNDSNLTIDELFEEKAILQTLQSLTKIEILGD